MTISQKITDTLKYFDTVKRGEGDDAKTITIYKETAPDALKDSIRAAHGDRMPDDWIFSTYESILSTFDGYTINSADDLEEHRAEVVDSCVDVYTSDLTAWLASSVYNVEYLDEAMSEYEPKDGIGLLTYAQSIAINEIAGHVIEYLTANAE